MNERLALYEATRVRLLARLVQLRAERKRMKWVALATVVAAVIARFFSMTAAVVVAIIGASLFFVGHYVFFAHIHDSKLTLAQIRENLDATRRGSAGRS